MARKHAGQPTFWESGETTPSGKTLYNVSGSGDSADDAPYTEDDLDYSQQKGNLPALQGTLFHPDTGTGKRSDPLTSMEQRADLARRRYNLGRPGVFKPGDEVDTQWTAGLANAVAQSSIPSHELAGQGPLLGPNSGSWDDFYDVPRDDPQSRLRISVAPDKVPDGALAAYHTKGHEVTVPENIDSFSLLHEIGHGEHMRAYPRRNGLKQGSPDPLLEGVADGFADRYERDYEKKVVDNSVVGSGTAYRIGEPTLRHHEIARRGQAYGANFEGNPIMETPGWENDTERALYAAARQQVATSGKPLTPNYQNDDYYNDRVASPYFGSDRAAQMLNHRQLSLGRLTHENPEVMSMFQAVEPEHSADWLNMRNAASDALTTYREGVHRADRESERRPKGPEAGWLASEEGMERHNEALQSSTLPLIDPQTGKQYDNTVERPAHPLPRIEHDKQTDRERWAASPGDVLHMRPRST